MSFTIQLSDAEYAALNAYARARAASPEDVVRSALEEYRKAHPAEGRPGLSVAEKLALIETMTGIIRLPEGVDDRTLITEARTEKYGPL